MSDLRRRHHTVARTLLQGFADGQRVRMIRRDGLDREVSIRDAAVGFDFYLFDSSDGKSDAVERWLDRHVESPAGPVLRRLRNGDAPTRSDVPTLARFAAASLLRTAELRRLMHHVDDHTAPLIVAQLMWQQHQVRVQDLTAAEIAWWLRLAREVWQNLEHDPSEVQRSQLRTMVRVWNRLRHTLEGWTWSISSCSRPLFFTADTPVVTLPADPAGFRGLLPPGCTVVLPLSPTRLLIAEEHPLAVIDAVTPVLASKVCTALAGQAHTALYCHPKVPLPGDLRASAQPAALPAPNVSVRHAEPGTSPTFPGSHPQVDDAAAADLLDLLGATDEVQ